MLESEDPTKQAKANTKAQFRQSPTIRKVGVDASVAAMDNYGSMSKKLFQEQGENGSVPRPSRGPCVR